MDNHHEMTVNQYKTYHEEFMRNNDGSSAFHTFSCIFMTIFCTIITSLISSYGFTVSFIQEYAMIVLPMVLIHTILSDWIYFINVIIFIIVTCLIIVHCNISEIHSTILQNNVFKTKHVHSISIMRGLTYLITIFSILAVDFKAFPRFLAKTEQYGYSLMDTGVGLFILMSGLVHKNYPKEPFKLYLSDNIKLISMLTILGVVRFVSVKQLDYQEHVTEYGVHWNFFFTLAAVKALAALLTFIVVSYNNLVCSFLVLSIHETLLSGKLENWVFKSQSRDTFISANKEGISSLLGFLSLYIFAVHTKKLLTRKNVIRIKVLSNFVILSIILWTLSYTVNIYRPASRTLANAGYCIFLEALFLSFTAILYFIESCISTNVIIKVPVIVKVMNENGLLIFLTGNLFTGAINMSTRTLFVQNYMAVLIFNAYMLSILMVGIFLNKLNIKL